MRKSNQGYKRSAAPIRESLRALLVSFLFKMTQVYDKSIRIKKNVFLCEKFHNVFNVKIKKTLFYIYDNVFTRSKKYYTLSAFKTNIRGLSSVRVIFFIYPLYSGIEHVYLKSPACLVINRRLAKSSLVICLKHLVIYIGFFVVCLRSFYVLVTFSCELI